VNFDIALAYNDPRELPVLAVAADEAGYAGLILSDHLVWPERRETPYPYTPDGAPRWDADTPWPDPFVTTGALATVTRRIRFITSIFVLPLRHPVLAAKQISTAAVLSDGRLVLGIGAGWMREEFDLVGTSFGQRGRRMDEALEVMRNLWTGEPVEHHGEFFDFDAVRMSPVPEEPIPVWAGGLSEPALRRAATRCDGWLSEIQRSDEIPGIVKRLRELRADGPRADRPFSICAAVLDAYTPDAFRRLRDEGVTDFITVPWLFYGQASSVQEKCDGIRRFADEMLAKLSDDPA
jgi:probable F420-dependent oxidoreductase